MAILQTNQLRANMCRKLEVKVGLISDSNYFKAMPKDIADILSRFKPGKPILEKKPIPTFRTTKEKDAYYDLQRKYWIEGKDGIPGTLVFKTQEAVLKNRITGLLEDPICRDADLYVHTRLEKAKKEKRSAGILKGRGFGLSTDFGILANHSFIIQPGCTVLMTSKDQPTIAKIFSDKVIVCYENIDPYIRPDLKNKNETKQTSFLSVKTDIINGYGEMKEAISTIFARDTSDSDKAAVAFSGSGAALGLYDELPLHRRKNQLLNSSIECYRNPRTKELDGFLIWGGTVEDTLSNEDLVEFKKTVEKSDTWRSDIIFLDCVWGMQPKDQPFTAWTDWAYGSEWHARELERLSKEGLEDDLRAFKKNNPRSLDDIFELASGSFWEDDVSKICADHYKRLDAEPNKGISTGRLRRIGKQVDWTPDREGFIEMLEPPHEGVQYFIGVDGAASQTNTTNSADSKRSKYAACVLKMYESPDAYNFTVAAQYCELPTKLEICHETILALAVWYKARVHIEANVGQGTAVVSHFINKGFQGLLLPVQKIEGTNIRKGKDVFSQNRNDSVLEAQKTFTNMFLRLYAENIRILSLMFEIATATDSERGKLDRLASFMTAVMAAAHVIFKSKDRETDVRKFIEHVVCEPDGQGGLVWKVKKYSIENPHENPLNLPPDSYTSPYLK